MEQTELIILIVGGVLAAVGGIAELTPTTWDNKILNVVKQVWAVVTLGLRRK